MATRENGLNINGILIWIAGAMGVVIMALSGFSSQQVLKTIDENKTAKKEAEEKQEKTNESFKNKLDEISRQLSENNSDFKILQSVITEQKEQISDLQKRVMILEIDKAKRDR